MKKNKIQVNELSKEAKVSLRTRIISAVVACIIILPAVFLGDWPFMGALLFCLLVAVVEIIRCDKKKYSRWLYFFSMLCISFICFFPLFRDFFNGSSQPAETWRVYQTFDNIYVSIIGLICSALALLYLIMWDENFTVRDACFIFMMGLLIALGFQSIAFLRFFPINSYYSASSYFDLKNTVQSTTLLFYVVIGTFGTDIGAYFIGMLFGKNKLNERISPKKTWEGFWGGIVISAILSMTFAFVLAINDLPIGNIFDLNHWWNIVVVSLMIPPFATLGDFIFSACKRYFEIKDFGKIMPGHGGVLDRLDSLLVSSIVVALYISIYNGALVGNPLI